MLTAEQHRAFEVWKAKRDATRSAKVWVLGPDGKAENRSIRLGLTSRERQIAAIVLAVHPSMNIASDRGISQRTVENYWASIMKNVDVRSLPALARLALAAACNGTDELPVKPFGEASA